MADDRIVTRRMMREPTTKMPPPREEENRGAGESLGTAGSGESSSATANGTSETTGSTAGVSTDVLVGQLQQRVFGLHTQPIASEASMLSSQSVRTVRSKRHGSVASSARRKRMAEARLEIEKNEVEHAEAKMRLAEAKVRAAQAALEAAHESSDSDSEEDNPTQRPNIEEWVNKSANISTRRDATPPAPTEPPLTREAASLVEALAGALRGLSARQEHTTGDFTSSQKPPRYLSELPTFEGNPLEWIPFAATFNDSKKWFTHAQNIARLRKALTGRAREAVKAQLFTDTHPDEIMRALESRFGRPVHIIKSEILALERLPSMTEDARNLPTIASAVNNCVVAIKQLRQESYLHSHEIAERVINKMCLHIKFKWYDHRKICDDQPILYALSQFLNEMAETIQANDTAIKWDRPRDKERTEKDFKPGRTRFQKKTVFHAVPGSCVDSDSDGNESEDYEYAEMVANAAHSVPTKCLACGKTDHVLARCKEYLKLAIPERWSLVKKEKVCFRCLRSNHRSFNCRAKACGVDGCEAGHHRTLHPVQRQLEAPPNNNAHIIATPEPEPVAAAIEQALTTVNTTRASKAFLKIMPVDVRGPTSTVRAYALLDDGSTITLIDQAVSDEIGAIGPKETLRLEGIGRPQEQSSATVAFEIKGAHQEEYTPITARTLEHLKICSQAVTELDVRDCEHLKDIEDQLVYERQQPRILLGQDNWQLLIARELREGAAHQPAATKTRLGWVLHGQRNSARQVSFVNHLNSTEKKDELHTIIKDHFQIESLGIEPKKPRHDPEQKALSLLDSMTRQTPAGRYETGLLWKDDHDSMPESRRQALKRLFGIRKKMDRSPEFAIEYSKQVNNLISSGYAERITTAPTSPRTWYLPHFAVIHPQKKKMRLVFDAAARSNGKCLNDALMTGPDLLQSLFGVLVRFRERKIAVCADIKEMFLRVGIKPEDRDSLRFLWLDDEGQVAEFRMNSLIFGAASSPCTAIYVKNHNAVKKGEHHPEAVEAIIRNHYMDDYLASFENSTQAIETSSAVDAIHRQATFELRGWASNNPEVQARFNAPAQSSVEIGAPVDYEKTLGLRWDTQSDSLSFTLSLRTSPPEILDGTRSPTKREVTSAVMSVFDPLGLAAPILIQGKSLIQAIWREGTDWDERVTTDSHNKWNDWLRELRQLENPHVPRCLATLSNEGEMHVFVDASERAYSACAYWRETNEGVVKITLIAGKARVSPLKLVSIPRLELQAAVAGSRLASAILQETTLKPTSTTFWSDSRTTLAWIKSDPRAFKPYVAHRLAEIEELTTPKQWRWVPTAHNVADDATRDAPPAFNVKHRWFNGPDFLREEPSKWPPDKSVKPPVTGEEKVESVNHAKPSAATMPMPDYHRFSRWKRLLHATARFVQCVNAFKRSIRPPAPSTTVELAHNNRAPLPAVPPPRLAPLAAAHLAVAEKMLVQKVQNDCYGGELECLSAARPIRRDSKIATIVTELRDDVMILSSRARAARFRPLAAEHLPVLDGCHPITRMILHHLHVQFGHANHQTVINEARQRYWIISLRTNVKMITRQCYWCRTKRASPSQPPEGDLPPERLHYKAPPFTNTGVDLFGPMTVGRRNEKRWGVLFTCLTTRAVHIELATSLSTNSLLLALRRMSSRRGTPRTIISDNGTNFIGAHRELKEAQLADGAAGKGIQWKFIPPGCPSMGGCWERMVRSVKIALSATLNERRPSEETLHTLLLEAEHVVNSRPLTEVDLDPDEQASLTPNHFLIGRSCGLTPIGEHANAEKPDWKAVEHLADQFWRRWLKEYVPSIVARRNIGRHYREPQRGDIVIIADSSLPRNTWPRGEIVETYPGPDGHVRVVDVRTTGGVMRRPSSRIVIVIPSAESAVSEHQDGCARTRGRL